MQPAIFLDRDGVICTNRDDYVKSWEEFTFLPGAKEALRLLATLEWPIVIVTNQSAVGRRLIDRATLSDIHRRMEAEIVAAGGRIDAIYYCPHLPEDNCPCRKPNPGMFLSAANALKLDLANSIAVGDALSDIRAAARAGIRRRYLVLTGRGQATLREVQHTYDPPYFIVAKDLHAVARQLLHQSTPYATERAAATGRP